MSEEKEALTVEGASKLGIGRLKPGGLVVDFRQLPDRKVLDAIIDRILDLHGCRTCGLAGLDLVIRPPDPLLEDRFRDIPEVGSVRRF